MKIKGKEKAEFLHVFRPSKLSLDLAIGRKYTRWYLIFARDYSLADRREVSRLDKSSFPLCASPNGNTCFWFNPKAVSGWERHGQTLLELLMADEPVFELTSTEDFVWGYETLKEVELLIPEPRLARWCEQCHIWETIGEEERWILRRRGSLPGYLCPSCYKRDWAGSQLVRVIHRIFQKP